MTNPVFGHHASADAYIRNGWKLCAIPAGTKGPISPGWNKVENALTVGQSLPTDGGIGLLHAYSGTCALDIDAYEPAAHWLRERGVNLDQLLSAPDAVQIDSGNAGHGKLIYALPFPLPSKKIVVGKQTILELRCASLNGLSVQDVLPPSRHPSGKTYQWAGKGHWQRLPTVPDALLALWMDMLEKDRERTVEVGAGMTPASIDEVRSAVMSINPDCDRKTWIEVGMGLALLGEELFHTWDEWSQGGSKYPGQRETIKQWLSFKPLPGGIGVGSVFHHAIKAGWKRPVPDMTGLFRPVEPTGTIRETVERFNGAAGIPTTRLNLWPDVLVARATELAKEVGCDPVVPLLAGLAAVSGAVDKRTSLSITPSWKVPPNLWTMTIGEPSDKKTPGSRPMFAPLRKLEHEDRNRYEAEMLKWKGIEARHAAEMKHYREWQASPDSAMPNAVPPNVTPLPPMPANLRLLVNDATSQKLVAMAEQRPKGFLLYLDEMQRWLSKLSDPRNGDDRGSWIQAYETGPYTMDRMGAGSIQVENLAMSLYGNCQPQVFRDTVKGASTDGIIQRFLPVVLNPNFNAMWQEAVPSWASSEHDYEQLIRRVFGMPAFEYRLSEGGNKVFREFCAGALKFRDVERRFNSSPTYQTALGKMEGNCARLILLFHIIDDPYSPEVAEDTVRKATKLFNTFFLPSLNYTYLEVGQQKDPMAEQLLTVLVQWASARPTITMSDLRRGIKSNEWANSQSPMAQIQMIRIAMDDYTNAGYVTLLQDHPRFPVWSINPAVANAFAEERAKIIADKQDRIEKMEAALIAQGKPPRRPLHPAIGS